MTPQHPAAADRLIVALDFPTDTQAMDLVDRLDGTCTWFKVGLELYLAAGPALIGTLRDRGHQVFLDLKLHDIPNTVAAAVRTVIPCGASLLTLHAAGGPAMLAAAAEAALAPGAPRLLAVTVLTSMDASQLAAIGITRPPAEQVLLLARMAHSVAIDGMVCSAEEVAALRAAFTPYTNLVVPGIRPAGASTNDQKRIATPASAILSGASQLVVGRPITQAANPAEAATAILSQIEAQIQAQIESQVRATPSELPSPSTV
jgi:orotidine-5'-phosphate decarboxylase